MSNIKDFLTGKGKKQQEKQKDIKMLYLFTDKQGWLKGFDVQEGKIKLKEGIRERTFSLENSWIYDIEDLDKKEKYKMLITSMDSGFGINTLAKVREGTPSADELTHLFNKAFMKKFNELQDIKPPTSMLMYILLGAGVMFLLLWVAQTFLGTKVL